LYISSVEFHNFSSYHGTNILDFESKSGVQGYAIFGHEGRGKTSLMKGVLWGLYGKVLGSFTDQSGIKKYAYRPIIDLSQIGSEHRMKGLAPLMSDQLVRANKFDMHVTIKFNHNNKNYVLKRVAENSKPNPRADSDISVKCYLTVDDRTVPPARIESVIGEIIPERISRFFFIEMDAIERYADLLFGVSANASIRGDVDAILGLPALDKSQESFDKISTQISKKIVQEKRKGTLNEGLEKEFNELDELIIEIGKTITETESEIGVLDLLIDDIDRKLDLEKGATLLIRDRKEYDREVNRCDKSIQNSYKSRSEMMSNDTWLLLLQPLVEKEIKNLNGRKSTAIRLTKDLGAVEKQIFRNRVLIDSSHGQEIECSECGNIESGGISHPDKEKMAKEIIEFGEQEIALQNDIDDLGNPGQLLDSLTYFRTSGSTSSQIQRIDDIEHKIGELIVNRSSWAKKLKAVKDHLDNHDVEGIAKLQNQRTNTIEFRGDKKGILRDAKANLVKLKQEKSDLVRKLKVNTGSSSKLRELELQRDTYDWLSSCFLTGLERYSKAAKKSVESIASETFLTTITEPEKYVKLTISEDWTVEVISSKTNKRTRVGNPGHRQIVAVSLFDGLRETSGREYPTFFDNPGSNISDEVLDRMVSHFWAPQKGQVVMMSHGGGLKQEDAISSYGEFLAKAWLLSYRGNGVTTEITEVEI